MKEEKTRSGTKGRVTFANMGLERQARKAREARSSYLERFRAEHRRNPLAEEKPPG